MSDCWDKRNLKGNKNYNIKKHERPKRTEKNYLKLFKTYLGQSNG